MSPITSYSSTLDLERVRYFPRQLITAHDLLDEQQFFLERLRRHNRLLHGAGIAYGFQVSAVSRVEQGQRERPWQVRIEPGYLLTPLGDEIFSQDAMFYDLLEQKVQLQKSHLRPDEPLPSDETPKVGDTVYLAIRYIERLTTPVQTLSGNCHCSTPAQQFSRIQSGFEVAALQTPPITRGGITRDAEFKQQLSGENLGDPWVALAKITIVSNSELKVENDIQRTLYHE